jgi:hypothetical protein
MTKCLTIHTITLFVTLVLTAASSATAPNMYNLNMAYGRTYMQIDQRKLIEHVRLAINPKFTHWVLFSNGTYIIIEDTTITDQAVLPKK